MGERLRCYGRFGLPDLNGVLMAYWAALLHSLRHPAPKPLVYTEPTVLMEIPW